MNDKERIHFATRYNSNEKEREIHHQKNPNLRYTDYRHRDPVKNSQPESNQRFEPPNQSNIHEPMDVDKSSTHINVHDRSRNTRFNPNLKRQLNRKKIATCQ